MMNKLEIMVKSTIIFSESKYEQQKNHTSNNFVTLSRNEYRKVIREAYHQGQSDFSKKKNVKNIQQQGKEEAIRLHAKQAEENRQRFMTITQRHDIELLRAHSVFPFTLFTDTLIIDTTKVTLSKKQLIATEYITTIPLKDLG